MPDINKTKECTKCGETKTLGQFYKRKEARDGRYSACIVCENIRVREAYKSGTPEEIAKRTTAKIEANKIKRISNP